MGKKRIWIVVLLVCVIGGALYVGQKYFHGFAASPNCVSDCWENGVRVR